VGVGAVVFHGRRVLLVRRGGPPAAGKWSVPGGLVELGETTEEAARREVREECGCAVRLVGLAGVLDRVIRDEAGRVRYHWVLVDYAAVADSDAVSAGTDAAEARWFDMDDVATLDVTDGLMDMIRRAWALVGGARG
jgi:ADP-ribose pyrophosphatase YjhB (NUDIX family)